MSLEIKPLTEDEIKQIQNQSSSPQQQLPVAPVNQQPLPVDQQPSGVLEIKPLTATSTYSFYTY